MKKSKLNLLAIAVLVLVAIGFSVNHKTVLGLQNMMNIPGRTIIVGNAKIDKHVDWLLVDMKTGQSNRNWLYGIVPCFFLKKCNADSSAYYIFFIGGGGKIAFLESDPEFVGRLNRLFSVGENKGGWEVDAVDEFKSYRFYGKDGGDEYVHYVFPDLMLDLWITAKDRDEINVCLENIEISTS